MTAPGRRGRGLASRVAERKRPEGRLSSATRLANQEPAPRGAVKVRVSDVRSGSTLTASAALAVGGRCRLLRDARALGCAAMDARELL